jgi:hypothetical protein
MLDANEEKMRRTEAAEIGFVRAVARYKMIDHKTQ